MRTIGPYILDIYIKETLLKSHFVEHDVVKCHLLPLFVVILGKRIAKYIEDLLVGR